MEFLIHGLLESAQDDNYSVEITENRVKEIIDSKCNIFKETQQVFYRGDFKMDKDCYLVNSNKTVTRMQFDFNYLTTEFVSSDLWKEKGLPLKKHSLNLSCSKDTTNVFGNEAYTVIPFDNAKLVRVKYLFGNYVTDRLKEEGFISQPSSIAEYLKMLLGNKTITLDNARECIKELDDIFKTDLDKYDDYYGKLGLTIKDGMKKHNMTFTEYMEYLFAPESYVIDIYDESFRTNHNYSYWTNSPVLLLKNSVYDKIKSELVSETLKKSKEVNGKAGLKIIDDKYVIYNGGQIRVRKFIKNNLPDNINIGDLQMGEYISYNGKTYTYEDFILTFIKPSLNETLYDTDTGVWWGKKGAGILPYCKETKRFLISFRSDEVLEPHTWGIWGGKIDDDEDPKIAAMREIHEESGYDGKVILIDSYVFEDENFKYYNFIGLVEEEFTPILDWETENYKWMTFEELLELQPKHFGLEALIKNNYKQLKNL